MYRFNRYPSTVDYPSSCEALINHVHSPRDYCIFHKRYGVYLDTVVISEKHNREANNEYLLCGSADDLFPTINLSSLNDKIADDFVSTQAGNVNGTKEVIPRKPPPPRPSTPECSRPPARQNPHPHLGFRERSRPNPRYQR